MPNTHHATSIQRSGANTKVHAQKMATPPHARHCWPVAMALRRNLVVTRRSANAAIGKESHVTRCLAGSNATFVYILRTGTKQLARS